MKRDTRFILLYMLGDLFKWVWRKIRNMKLTLSILIFITFGLSSCAFSQKSKVEEQPLCFDMKDYKWAGLCYITQIGDTTDSRVYVKLQPLNLTHYTIKDFTTLTVGSLINITDYDDEYWLPIKTIRSFNVHEAVVSVSLKGLEGFSIVPHSLDARVYIKKLVRNE